MRQLIANLPASERVLTVLALALVVAIVVEVAFLRMFARAGIYIFQDNSPEWLYTIYNSLVWLGRAALNFATILAPVLLLVLVVVLWQRGTRVSRLVSVVVLVTLGMEGSLFLVSSNPGLSLTYFGSSIFLVGLALVLYWRSGGSLRMALTLGPLLIMFLASYWYKVAPLAHQLGGEWFPGSIAAFQLSEGLLLLVAISLPIAIGLSRSPKVWVGSILLTSPLIGLYLGNPDMIPLISMWAFGITMYLPFWIYVLALWAVSVAILTLLNRGHLLPAFALVILLSSHRELPLTYFNNLTLIALLLIATRPWPVPRPLGQWRLWENSLHNKAVVPRSVEGETANLN